VRFSSKIFGALAAAPVAAFAAYEKAHSGFKPNPPAPEFDKVIGSILSGTDLLASGSAAFAAFSAFYAIYEIFKPDPATKKDINKDGRITREGLEHLSRQGVAEGQASEDRDKLTHRLVSGELHERVTVAVEADLLNEEQLNGIYKAAAKKLDREGTHSSTENIIEAAVRSSDEVQQLLADGKSAEAGEAQLKLAEAGDARQAQCWRDTARILKSVSITKAITAYNRATFLDSRDFRTWIELSRLHQEAGSLSDAYQSATESLKHAQDDFDRMVAENMAGDIAIAEGQLQSAARRYQAGLKAARAVLAVDPDNRGRQREVSVSHNRLGDVAVALGDLAGARSDYSASLAIFERIASQDEGNAEGQRDLSVSYDRLGNVAVVQGDLVGARAAYETSRAIRDRLAAQDKDNAQWQRDLSVSYDKLGDVAVDEGDLAGARAAYGASLVIFERLAASDPGNAGWQRDLSVSYGKIGDVAVALGDVAGARTAYAASLAIFERLAASDPGNAGWQRDLFVSYYNLAQLAEASGDVAGAIREFEAGEAILVALIARVGDHPGFIRDLAQVRREIARLRGG
jgi:tetratricopeptide (TPR) repeat protein